MVEHALTTTALLPEYFRCFAVLFGHSTLQLHDVRVQSVALSTKTQRKPTAVQKSRVQLLCTKSLCCAFVQLILDAYAYTSQFM